MYRPTGGTKIETFYNGIRTGYPYVAKHLGWYVNNFSQEDYYKSTNNAISTSLNDSAMDDFRRSVMAQLAMKQGLLLYPMIKDIYSVEFIRSHTSWSSVIKCICYLFVKKVLVSLRIK